MSDIGEVKESWRVPFMFVVKMGYPLTVCNPRGSIPCAPSGTHADLYCHSVVLYRDCPFYEFQISDRKPKIDRWTELLEKILPFLPREVNTGGHST